MELTVIIPPIEIRRGTENVKFQETLETIQRAYYIIGHRYHLDMSDVIFMDSHGFRQIFDYLSIFTKITPPKCKHVIEMYDLWLDSKKGLRKNT